jgi:hypothetical protein
MTHRHLPIILAALTVHGGGMPVWVVAQNCAVPASVRDRLPADGPASGPYAPLGRDTVPFDEIDLGVGHLYHPLDQPAGVPPGSDDWLRQVELPLSTIEGAPPSSWIARGWIIPPIGDPQPLATTGLLETGYEELSFVVLQRSADWLRIRYSVAESGTAWVPACALEASPARLEFAAWSDWFLGGEISPLFVRGARTLDLRSAPSVNLAPLTVTTTGDAIEPHEVRGGWMRVTLVRPSDYCEIESTSTRTEGWIRWLTLDRGPALWYFTRGC